VVRSRIHVIIMAMRLSLVVAALVACGTRAAGADPKPMRLLTYNLNYANPDRGTTMRAIADVDADVVLLQEVDTDWKRELAQTFAKRYPFQAFRSAQRYAGGIAVLSKTKIDAEEAIPSPHATWFPAQRVVIGDLQILNVHLRPAVDHGSWIKGFMTTPPLRLKEVEAYWPRLTANMSTIVAGDFNEDPSGSAIAFLAKHGLSRVPTKGPRTWHYVDNGHEVLKMDIDHVMIDGTLTASGGEVLDVGTSDHRPVVVTVEHR
jgi:endonuclease/exonuclease/phosphatase (EEP) superfamily protein YafD